MEVKAGYRQSEIGVLPADWVVRPLSQLFSFKNGVNAEKRAYGTGVPFVNVLETIRHSHLSCADIPGRVTLSKSICANYRVRRGDALFNRTSETESELALAATYVDSEEVVFGGFVIRGRPISEDLNPEYSGYALRARALREQIIPLGQGAVRANIGQEALGRVLAPLPPTAEQHAIAESLMDVDALLSSLDRLVAKTRDVKQAAMQQLLTGQTRLSGFQSEWTWKRLSEVGEISGSGVDKKSRPDEVPVRLINYMDVYRRSLIYATELEHAVTAQPHHALRCRVMKGDVFFTPSSETRDDIAHSAVAMEDIADAAYSYHIVRLRLSEPWDLRFRAYAFKTAAFYRQAEKVCDGGGTRYVISLGKFRGLVVHVPPVPEQAAIAEVLWAMDEELAALEARRDKTHALKQGMMQALLTGRTRLVDAMPAAAVQDQMPTQERKANIYFMRAVLAAEIVDQLHQEPTFGHVKLEKMVFLAEHLCQVDTGSTYLRKAAGPLDRKALHSIDSQLRSQHWFDARQQDGRYTYVPLAKRGGHKAYFDRYYTPIAAKLSGIIETFRTLGTERCEIVATLYAAWNDLLRDERSASDDSIVHEVLNDWHDAKQRIPEDRWRKALGWMREKGFVPQEAALP